MIAASAEQSLEAPALPDMQRGFHGCIVMSPGGARVYLQRLPALREHFVPVFLCRLTLHMLRVWWVILASGLCYWSPACWHLQAARFSRHGSFTASTCGVFRAGLGASVALKVPDRMAQPETAGSSYSPRTQCLQGLNTNS